jgi:acetate kinase
MNILVLNCGSSSVKYQLINGDEQKKLAGGVVERIGMSGATLSNVRYDGDEIKIAGEIVDHTVAIEYILAILLSRNHGVISDKSDIHAIGHRVVHGGETFSGSVLITSAVIKTLQENIELAPLHNPHNLRGISACDANLPGTRRPGSSTRSISGCRRRHISMASCALCQYKIRRYGFGTSHGVADRAARRPSLEPNHHHPPGRRMQHGRRDRACPSIPR